VTLRLTWREEAIADLEAAAEWSSRQALAVLNAVESLAAHGFMVGTVVPSVRGADTWPSTARYWPAPPLGVVVDYPPGELVVLAVIDLRRHSGRPAR
jgi:hypothetical protein